jgi:hypothetical protein
VEAPAGLRADILSVIAQRPAARVFTTKDWFISLLAKPQLVWGSSLAAAAVIVLFAVLVVHTPSHTGGGAGSGSGIQAGMGPDGAAIAPMDNPLLQNVALKEGDQGLNYEVFTLHAPPLITSPLTVNAFVLQSGGPIADQTMVTNADKATPAWSGTLDPHVSLSLPVSVTSNLPAGSSLDLLLQWNTQDGTQSGREVAFVPITAAAASPTAVAPGTSFYDALKTIAGEYQQTIVADNGALSALASVGPLDGTTGNELNAEVALNSVLTSSGFKVQMQPGGYYLITHP